MTLASPMSAETVTVHCAWSFYNTLNSGVSEQIDYGHTEILLVILKN